MIHFEVSVLPLVAVAAANFLLSWLYYSPVTPWFKAWQKGVGMDPGKTEMTEDEKRAMPLLFGGAIAASFLLSYGIQVVVHSVGAADFWTGALAGAVVWAAFAVPHSLNTLFEGRKPAVLVINNGLYLLTYTGFAGWIAVWK